MNDMITKTADVVVIGGGSAGFGAAIAAARKGLKTYLVEKNNKIGGVLNMAPGMPFGGAYPLNKTIGGVMEELAASLYNMDPPAAEKRKCHIEEFGPEIFYDNETMMCKMYEMLDDAGVNLMIDTTAIKPLMDGDTIKAVEFFNGDTFVTIEAKIFIDCSGDGKIAALAGVPFQKGDENGNMMGASMTFLMCDADWDKIFYEGHDPLFQKSAAKGIAEGKLHPDLHQMYILKGFKKDSAYFNTVIVTNVDGTNPESIGDASIEARKRCVALADYVKKNIPGFENAYMKDLGALVAIRETRKLEGMYRLTIEDLTAGTKFDDGIVCCDNPLDDVHRGKNEMTNYTIGEYGVYYTLPFRCLVPKKIKNLMFAGRNLSSDPTAFASVRGMPTCMLMGQACGTAAYYSIKGELAVQDINFNDLILDLQEQGVKGLAGTSL